MCDDKCCQHNDIELIDFDEIIQEIQELKEIIKDQQREQERIKYEQRDLETRIDFIQQQIKNWK